MGDLDIQSLLRIETLLQRHVVAGELGLGGGLGREYESPPCLLRG